MSDIVKVKPSAFIREQMAKGKTTKQIRSLAARRGIKFSANLPYVVKYYDKKRGLPVPKRSKTPAPLALTQTERDFLHLVFFKVGTERAVKLIEDFKVEVLRRLSAL